MEHESLLAWTAKAIYGKINNMKTNEWICIAACGLALVSGLSAQATRDLYSDTWVATDGLGRTLATGAECGPPRTDRTVGIFYFLWLGQHGQAGPFDITQLLAADPENPKWGPPGAFHHWGKPELGYYVSDSEYVIRRHCSMLNDAEVDTLIFDATNAVPYTNVYGTLCKVFEELRSQGNRTPQFCFVTHSAAKQTIETLYRDLYSKNLYPELWFRWKGKPLILGDDWEGLSPEIREFFTIRKCWAWTHGKDTWQWLDHSENRYGWHESADKAEELAVCVAEHPTTNIGRSFQAGRQPAINQAGLTGSEGRGLFFAEQISRALKIGPEFAFVTGWNEWVAQRFLQEAGKPAGAFVGRVLATGQTFFVDAYNQEYSRDIEPMAGGHTDNYYYQLVDFVRRYKGVRPIPTAKKDYSIEIDGKFEEWKGVEPEFRDTIGDTEHRNEKGWGEKLTYADTSGRNDFVTLKVASDAEQVYFYAQTRQMISPRTDSRWMLLLIDADCNPATGWGGYDYLVNREVSGPRQTTLCRWEGGQWKTTGAPAYAVGGNEMELAIAKADLGIGKGAFRLDFHWADNPRKLEDPIDLALSGDSAPNRRFNYRYIRE
jgi:hypothetical protein